MQLLGNYIKIGFRNLKRNRAHSFINIVGLSVGMAVAILIGLWIWDEMSFNKYHQHYSRIVQVYSMMSSKQGKGTNEGMPVPVAEALRTGFPNDFRYVTAVNSMQFLMKNGNNTFVQEGVNMEADGPEMLTLNMLKGSRAGLRDPRSIFLSASLAKKIFGSGDPMGRPLTLNNVFSLQVSGVYADLPKNTSMREVSFITPWEFFVTNYDWIKKFKNDWGANTNVVLAEVNPNVDIQKLSAKIKDLITIHHPDKNEKVDLFLYPMSRWHLYGRFDNGVESGGLITFVRFFGLIGIFVLLLACINFMNLSTARSEKRAREVGIRKTMGSARSQLLGQFFSESVMMSLIAFFFSLIIVQLILPWFNHVADKQLSIPAFTPVFWAAGLLFSLLTGIIAGSYPAIYLSSFQPIKVLKGTFRVGRLATLPRKVLVVVQFTVSVALIIGTVIIFRQIQYAKDRPVGYDRSGLISIQMRTHEIYQNYNAIREELLSKGYAVEMAESQCPVTDIWAGDSDFEWEGKDAGINASFATIGVRAEYGKTLGWQFMEGRDFTRDHATDSSGLILNETAVKYMGLKDPVGKTIRWKKENYKILGVIHDMVMTSPYQSIPQTIFYILREGGNFVNIRINPRLSVQAGLKGIGSVFKKLDPGAPFSYTFAGDEYAKKFSAEERIGKLAGFFAALAIFISCLGLFGLASFVAEQRTREIGVRKVLGATVGSIWRLLSTDFVLLVAISLVIATPLSWWFMHKWLQNFSYRAGISWWIFVCTGLGAMLITIMTVSFQAIRAALMNPVKSLRTE